MRMHPRASRRKRVATFGSVGLLLILMSGTMVSAHGGAGPSIFVTPVEAPPGAAVHIVGSDFAPFVDLELSLRSASQRHVLGVAVSGADGHFSRRVVLPGSLPADGNVVFARSADGAVAESPLRIAPGTGSVEGSTAGGQQLDDRLPIVLVFGVVAAIVVLSLVVAWGLYHGAAVKLHRARVELDLSRSRDPFFARPGRRWRRSAPLETVSLERVGGASFDSPPAPEAAAASGTEPGGRPA